MSAVGGAGAEMAALPDADRLPGPVYAQVIRVIDGDTIAVRARIWLKQEVETNVRVAGLDTPELRSSCGEEREKAQAARALVETRLTEGWVALYDIGFEKYGGRVVAEIRLPDGERLADALISAGLGRPYDGGRKRKWCD